MTFVLAYASAAPRARIGEERGAAALMDEARVRELLDKHEIAEVLARYARGVDRMDRELAGSCFQPDAFVDHGDAKGSVDEHLDWVFQFLAPTTVSMHRIGNLLIDVQGDSAYTEAYCVPYLRRETDQGVEDEYFVMRFIDRLERRDEGAWLIAHRVVAFDWSRIEPVERQREFTADFIRGQRDRADPVYERLR